MLEYVASGTSYLRINYPISHENEDNLSLIKDFFTEVDNKNNHRFSLLYNAYTESKFGKIFEKFSDSFYKTHADSGGLQIITQGKTVDDAFKKTIYKNQADYADVGMCFDEIPLVVTGKKSKRNDVSNRFFDKDNLKDYAQKTGLNVKEQIEVYLENNSNCKPYFIIHGNDIETAIDWVNYSLDVIPNDLRKHIGGIAMGGGTFGNGLKESLLRAFLAGYILQTRDDLVNKNLHFLGLGSLTNAFPFLVFLSSGLYNKEWCISYDSTSHTQAHHNGNYINNEGKSIEMGRAYTNRYKIIYDDVCINSDVFKNLDVPLKEFYKVLNSPAGKYIESNNFATFLSVNLVCALSTITNFTRKINQYATNLEDFLHERIPGNKWSIYKSLSNIKTLDDYKYWDKTVGCYVPSIKILNGQSNNLDNF